MGSKFGGVPATARRGQPARPGDDARSCCMGAAARGICTCWRPVFDREQSTPVSAAPEVRRGMCVDCACRPGSPERRGDERYQSSYEGVVEAVEGRGVFYCHDGMRKILRDEHPDGSTFERPADLDSYAPPIVDGVPYRADGRPAFVCAGFAAMRDRLRGEGG